MNQRFVLSKRNEQGGARAKFIIFIAIFALVIYLGYMYVPVALDAYYFKDIMQNKVDLAATQGYDTAWVTDQLKKNGRDYHVPEEAVISTIQKDNRFEARAQFTRPISFPGYTYNYEFDHTAKSTAFLVIK